MRSGKAVLLRMPAIQDLSWFCTNKMASNETAAKAAANRARVLLTIYPHSLHRYCFACCAAHKLSRLGLQALHAPLPVSITRKHDAVVEARAPALPEFDALGLQAVAAPVL